MLKQRRAAEGDTVPGEAWERAAGNVAAAARPESVRGNSFLSENPRGRLLRLGAAALTDSELLSILLAVAARGNPVCALADTLLATGGGLKALFQKDPQELASHPGLGPIRASQMLAALELGRRVQKSGEQRPRLRLPREVYEHLAPVLQAQRHEQFRVLCFNTRNFLLRDALVSQGTSDCCAVDTREVFAPAVLSRASAIILAHNHPSGEPDPSPQDLALTQRLVDAGLLLGIRVMDHLILGDDCYASLAERGQLPLPRAAAAVMEPWPTAPSH